VATVSFTREREVTFNDANLASEAAERFLPIESLGDEGVATEGVAPVVGEAVGAN
jgi:hypothetical protein